jgi:hypothetical protein
MAIVLLLWGLIAGGYGVFAVVSSQSAAHEIETGIWSLIATVAIGCAGIIDAVKKNRASVSSQSIAESEEAREMRFQLINTIRAAVPEDRK